MNFLKFLIIVGLVGSGYNWWHKKSSAELAASLQSPDGFVAAAMPDGAPADTVIILAPQNCPSEAAQRADALAQRLSQAGIRNARSASYSASVANPSDEQKAAIQRAVTIINGEIPAVFVHGMAKANPTFDEVVSEFRRTGL